MLAHISIANYSLTLLLFTPFISAACVSVHGANRLGANSLLDIVVFGRACANHVCTHLHILSHLSNGANGLLSYGDMIIIHTYTLSHLAAHIRYTLTRDDHLHSFARMEITAILLRLSKNCNF